MHSIHKEIGWCLKSVDLLSFRNRHCEPSQKRWARNDGSTLLNQHREIVNIPENKDFRGMLVRLLSFFLIFFSTVTRVYAENNIKGLGDYANDLLSPVNTLGDFIGVSSAILGAFCCFLGFFQYLEYRKNAYSAPLSSVFAMVIPGVLFISLPFLPFIIGAGFATP